MGHSTFWGDVGPTASTATTYRSRCLRAGAEAFVWACGIVCSVGMIVINVATWLA